MCDRQTTAEVRLDARKAARFSDLEQTVGGFAGFSPTRLPCPKTPEDAILPATDGNPGECRIRTVNARMSGNPGQQMGSRAGWLPDGKADSLSWQASATRASARSTRINGSCRQ